MPTTTSRIISVAIDRDLEAAYAFLSRPGNFPLWASGLGSLSLKDGCWTAETPGGTMAIRFSEPNSLGVLDHWVTPPSGPAIYIPFRVVANGDGCELTFTLFRQPGTDQARFDADADWVLRDLQAVKRLLEKCGYRP